jgi:hypothetical protein
MTQPINVEVNIRLHEPVDELDDDDEMIVLQSKSFARLLADLVEEATRRGMEAGARMVLDAESTQDEDEAKPFPGFLGATTDEEDYDDE